MEGFYHRARNDPDADSGVVAMSESEQEDMEAAKRELAAADWQAQTEHCVDWLADNVTGPVIAACIFNDPTRPLESDLRRSVAIRNLRTSYIESAAYYMDDERARQHLGVEA